jgi:hypothetical protein
MQSNDVIEVVTPLGGGASELSLSSTFATSRRATVTTRMER